MGTGVSCDYRIGLGEPSRPLYTDLIAVVSSLIDITLPFLYTIYSTKEQTEITTATTPCRCGAYMIMII